MSTALRVLLPAQATVAAEAFRQSSVPPIVEPPSVGRSTTFEDDTPDTGSEKTIVMPPVNDDAGVTALVGGAVSFVACADAAGPVLPGPSVADAVAVNAPSRSELRFTVTENAPVVPSALFAPVTAGVDVVASSTDTLT